MSLSERKAPLHLNQMNIPSLINLATYIPTVLTLNSDILISLERIRKRMRPARKEEEHLLRSSLRASAWELASWSSRNCELSSCRTFELASRRTDDLEMYRLSAILTKQYLLRETGAQLKL